MPYNAILQSRDEWRAKNRSSVMPPFWKRKSDASLHKPSRPVTEFMFYPVEIHSVEDLESVSPLMPSGLKPWADDDNIPPVPKIDTKYGNPNGVNGAFTKRQSRADAYDALTANDPSNKPSGGMPVDSPMASTELTTTEIPSPIRNKRHDSILARDWRPQTACEPRAEAYDNLTASNRASKRTSWYDNMVSSERASQRRSFAPTENYHAPQSSISSSVQTSPKQKRQSILAKDWKPVTQPDPRAEAYDSLTSAQNHPPPPPEPASASSPKRPGLRKKVSAFFKKSIKLTATGAARSTGFGATISDKRVNVSPERPTYQRSFPSQEAGRAFVELPDMDGMRPDSGVEIGTADRITALPSIATPSARNPYGSASRRQSQSVTNVPTAPKKGHRYSVTW